MMNPDHTATFMAGRVDEPKAIGVGLTVLLSLGLLAVVTVLTFSGFGIRGDSSRYIHHALHMAASPSLGTDHWSLRHPLVQPMVVSFLTLGPGELQAMLPNMLYAAGTVGVSAWFAHRLMAPGAGLALGVLIATSCFITIEAMRTTIYGPELFFGVLALWLFACRLCGRGGDGVLVAAGIAAAGGWLCRETAAFAPMTFVVAGALLGGRERVRIVLIPCIAFCGVLAVEMLAYLIVAGDPLYRYRVDLGHGKAGAAIVEQAPDFVEATMMDNLRRAVRLALRSSAVGPFLLLGIVGVALAAIRGAIAGHTARILGVFTVGGLISFVLSSWLLSLETPDYYPILPYASAIWCTVGIAAFWRQDRRLAAGALGMLAVASLGVENLRDDRELDKLRIGVAEARALGEPVVFDGLNAHIAQADLRLSGMSVEQAETVILSPAGIAPGRLVAITPWVEIFPITIQPGWVPETTAELPAEPPLRQLAVSLGIASTAAFTEREITFYRVPAD